VPVEHGLSVCKDDPGDSLQLSSIRSSSKNHRLRRARNPSGEGGGVKSSSLHSFIRAPTPTHARRDARAIPTSLGEAVQRIYSRRVRGFEPLHLHRGKGRCSRELRQWPGSFAGTPRKRAIAWCCE
jgi:hypothetical protein